MKPIAAVPRREGRTMVDRRVGSLAACLAGGLAVAVGGLGGGQSARAHDPQQVGHGPVPTNIRVSRDSYTAHGQPTLAVNPRDTRNLLGAAMALGQGTLVEETFASTDDGRTWHDNGPLPLPNGVSFGGDPTVAFDRHGTGFVAALGESQAGDGVYVWRTDDGGRSFHPPVTVVQGQPADHPWLAAGTSPGQESGDLYVAWATRDLVGPGHADGLAFSRSTTGGRSFTRPRIISALASGVSIPAVAAGPRGAVYVAYVTLRPPRPRQSRTAPAMSASPGVNREEVQVVSSKDEGQHFGQPTVAGPATSLLASVPGVSLTTQPSVAVDPRDASVYVAYSSYRAGATHAEVLLARSRDGGHTWSTAVPVTAQPPSSSTIYFQPHVVTDSTGTVDVTLFALAHGHVDVLLARSATHGASFGPLQVVTNHAFDPALGWSGQKTGAWWIGDYQGLAAGGNLIHPFWNDTRNGQLEIYTAAIPDGGH